MLINIVLLLASARTLPRTVLAFGDSLTAGLIGESAPKAYAPYGDVVASLLGVEVVSSKCTHELLRPPHVCQRLN